MATSSSPEHVEVPLDTALPPLPESPLPPTFVSDVTEHHQDTMATPTIRRVRANENQAITRTDDRLDETNWTVWRHRLTLMLQICGVQGYVSGAVQRPDITKALEGASNWDFNDTCR